MRRALAAVAGRFVSWNRKVGARGWERLGFARPGDYARERLGLSARALYDLAAVDAALAELPRLDAALVSGSLPWTKVRLVARAARPEDEERWLAYARSVPTSELEAEARAVDTGSIETGAAGTDPEGHELPRERVYYSVSADTAAKWQFGWRLARRVAGQALDIGSCAELMLAEMLSALPMDSVAQRDLDRGEAPEHPGRTPAERCSARILGRCRGADSAHTEGDGVEAPALPASMKGLVEGLDEADPFELDRRLRRIVALEQRAEAELGPWLERVAAERLYRRRGYANLDAYARERLGLSPRKARALLRIERAGRRCPALGDAYREGCLSWVQAQALIPVLLIHPARGRAWITFARQVPVRRLRDDVDRALLLAERDPQTSAETGGVPELREGEHLQTRAKPGDPERTCSPPAPGLPPARRACQISFMAPADVARLFRSLVRTVQRKLGRWATPGDALDAILEHCFAEWTRPDPTRPRERYHRIYQRDGWRCAVPVCESYRNLQAHHKQYRSRQGDEADENLITLCAWHHLRAVHEQRWIRISGREITRFELGLRPGAPPLLSYESGPTLQG